MFKKKMDSGILKRRQIIGTIIILLEGRNLLGTDDRFFQDPRDTNASQR